MKKVTFSNFFRGIITILLIFFALLFYLHQKVCVFVEAYRLNKNYRCFNELVDKKDYLAYNLAKDVSLAKINKWTEDNHFFLAKKEEIIAFSVKREEPVVRRGQLASVFSRLLGISSDLPEAIAKENE
ncbi:MAG: hypothetical protein JSW40_05830 [Candidatus Omnitrophota bacterium]|nr:MAG: hypothetical protein JSW40_05830 [Candidatus Omnitrophota bacterium]